VKPSYGLTDDEVAAMLRDGFEHAQADRDARALAEQRVEAERASLEGGIASVEAARRGEDHRALKAAVEALNRASEPFAGRRMDRSVSSALAGRRLDEVPVK
jgi:molecular chaperone HscA